jgi:hypothetical protein
VPIALTGCLRASDEPRVFLLTNAVRADDDVDRGETDDAKSSASGAPATTAKNEGRTYRIVPLGAQLDLKSHVGEQVDVGGRLATTDSLHGTSSKSGGGAGAAPDADDPNAGKEKQSSSRLEKSPPPTIAVTYVRKVAATCGAAGAKP